MRIILIALLMIVGSSSLGHAVEISSAETLCTNVKRDMYTKDAHLSTGRFESEFKIFLTTKFDIASSREVEPSSYHYPLTYSEVTLIGDVITSLESCSSGKSHSTEVSRQFSTKKLILKRLNNEPFDIQVWHSHLDRLGPYMKVITDTLFCEEVITTTTSCS